METTLTAVEFIELWTINFYKSGEIIIRDIETGNIFYTQDETECIEYLLDAYNNNRGLDIYYNMKCYVRDILEKPIKQETQ